MLEAINIIKQHARAALEKIASSARFEPNCGTLLIYIFMPLPAAYACEPKFPEVCPAIIISTGAVLYADKRGNRTRVKIRNMEVGDLFFTLVHKDNWVKADLTDGQNGWVENRYVEIRRPEEVTVLARAKEVPIYSEMNETSAAKGKLLAGEVEEADKIVAQGRGYWINIGPSNSQNTRQHPTGGWVKSEDAELVLAGILREMGIELMWGGRNRKKNLDQALSFFDLMVKKHSSAEFFIDEPFSGEERRHGGIDGLMLGAKLYVVKGDYDKALERLRIVGEKYQAWRSKTETPAVTAYCEMGKIYLEKLNNKGKAAEMYHAVIKAFPDSDFRSKDTGPSDLSAAYLLFQLWKDNKERTLLESELVIAESRSEEIRAFAHRKAVEAYRDSGELEEAVLRARRFLVELPYGATHKFWFNPYFYSMNTVSELVEKIFTDKEDETAAITLCGKMISGVSDWKVKMFLNYKIAESLDEGAGNLETVRTSYSQLIKNYPPTDFELPFNKKYGLENGIREKILDRMSELEFVAPQTAHIISDKAPIFKKYSADSVKIGDIRKGAKVSILYALGGERVKVAMLNGKTGWVSKDAIAADEEPASLLGSIKGRFGTGSVSKDILHPVLKAVIPIHVEVEPLFWDANSDGALDILIERRGGRYASELMAIDGKSGKTLWTEIHDFSLTETPLLQEGTLYEKRAMDTFFVRDAKTGKANSNFIMGAMIRNGTVRDKVLYIQRNGEFCALNSLTGAKLWSVPLRNDSNSPPIVKKERVWTIAMKFGKGTVASIDLPGKRVLWEYKVGKTIESSLMLVGANLLFTAADGKLHCLDAKNGSLRWAIPVNGRLWGSSMKGKTLLFKKENSASALLSAVNAKTGKTTWRKEIPESCSNPGILPESVNFGCGDGNIYSLALQDGKKRWTLSAPEKYSIGSNSRTAVLNGFLFLNSKQGLLVIGDKD